MVTWTIEEKRRMAIEAGTAVDEGRSTFSEYCRDHDLHRSTLSAWVHLYHYKDYERGSGKKEVPEAGNGKLVLLKPAGNRPNAAETGKRPQAIEVTTPYCTIRLEAETAPATLANVFRALRGATL